MTTSTSVERVPKTWVGAAWRLITERPLHAICVVLFLLVVGCAMTLLLVRLGVTELGPIKFARSPSPLGIPRLKLDASFANFGNVWPTTNTGRDWQIFNDNKFLGHSAVWYETVPNPRVPNDFVLRIHFSLDRGPRSMAGDAYAGIFVDLNPPLGSVDLSEYSGISFRARRVDDPNAQSLRFIVNLANPEIKNFAYHEFEFTDRLQRGGALAPVSLPFALFHQPDWATAADRVSSFDASNVYRISFFVKGDRGAGYMDLDDIEFIRGQKP